MDVRGLLSAWTTPAAIWPNDASLSAWIIRASKLSRSRRARARRRKRGAGVDEARRPRAMARALERMRRWRGVPVELVVGRGQMKRGAGGASARPPSRTRALALGRRASDRPPPIRRRLRPAAAPRADRGARPRAPARSTRQRRSWTRSSPALRPSPRPPRTHPKRWGARPPPRAVESSHAAGTTSGTRARGDDSASGKLTRTAEVMGALSRPDGKMSLDRSPGGDDSVFRSGVEPLRIRLSYRLSFTLSSMLFVEDEDPATIQIEDACVSDVRFGLVLNDLADQSSRSRPCARPR